MRKYAEKMAKYRIPQQEYIELRQRCYNDRSEDFIAAVRAAVDIVAPDGLGPYIFRHVTDKRYNMAKMQCDGLPCHEVTFRVYRARLFYELSKLLHESERASSGS